MVCKKAIVCFSAVLLVTASTVVVTVLLNNQVSVVQQEALASSGCIINNLYPDETDCTRFYMCSPYGLQSFECPSGLHFNPVANYCDWPDIAGCLLITSTTPEFYDEDIVTMLPPDISTIYSGTGSGSNEDYLQEITNSQEHLTTSLTDSLSISANDEETALPNEHFSSSYTSYVDSSTVTKEDDITFSDRQEQITEINKGFIDFATQYLVTQKELPESVHQSGSYDSLEELSTKSENSISSHNIYKNSDSEVIVTSEKLFVTEFTTENEKLDEHLNTDQDIIRTTENYDLSQSNSELQNNASFEFADTKKPIVNTESATVFVEEPNVDSFSTHEDIQITLNYLLNQGNFDDSDTQNFKSTEALINHSITLAISKSPTILTSAVDSSGPTTKTSVIPDPSSSYSTNSEISEEHSVTEQILSAVRNTTEKNFYDTSIEPSVVESSVVETNTMPSDYRDITTFISSEAVETEPVNDVTIKEINVSTVSNSVSLNLNSITEFLTLNTDLPHLKQTSASVTTIFISSNSSDPEVNITLSNSNLDIDDKNVTSTSSESLASHTEMPLNKNITASEFISSTNENNNEQFSTMAQIEFSETDQLEITTEHSLMTNQNTISEYNLDVLNTYPEMNTVTEEDYLRKTSSVDDNFTDIQYHDKLFTVSDENSVTQEVDKILFSASTESVTKDRETLLSGTSNNTESTEETTLPVTSPYTDPALVLYFSDGATPNELINGSYISKSEIVSNSTIASSPVSLEVDNAVSNPSKVSNISSKGDTTTTDTNQSTTETSFDENFKQESIFDNTLSHVETSSAQNDSYAQHLDVTETYDSSTDVSSTTQLEETTNYNILGVTSNNLVVTEQKTSSANVSEHMPTTEQSVHETTTSSNLELHIQTDVQGSTKNSIITTSSNLMVTKISLPTEEPTEINGISDNVEDYDLIYNEIDESDTVSTETMFTQKSDSAVSSKLNETESEINIAFTESVTSNLSTFTLNESDDSSLEYNSTQDITTESTANLSYSIKVIITVTAQDSFPSNSTHTEDDSISNIVEDFIDNGLETIKDFSEVETNDAFSDYTGTTDNVVENDNDENNDNDDDDEEEDEDDENDDEYDDDNNNVDVNKDGDGKGEDDVNENVNKENGEEHQHYNSHKHRYDDDRDHKNKNHEDNIIGDKKEDKYHNNRKHKHHENKFKEVYKLDYNPDPSNGNNNRQNQKDAINNKSEKKNIKSIQNRHHESTRRESKRKKKQENIEVFYKLIGKFKKTVNWF